jgi:hypothetical protein
MLTLDEFRQTRKLETDLAARFGIDDENGPTRGYVYAGECYIISTRRGSADLYYLPSAITSGSAATLHDRKNGFTRSGMSTNTRALRFRVW